MRTMRLDAFSAHRAARHILRVAWFDSWCPELDDALQELPEMCTCPHDLFRLVMQNPSPTRKRAALVTEGDGPVAVVGLREKGGYWLPVMQDILPVCIAPAREGLLFPALRALDVDVRITGSLTTPPRSVHARNAVPVFKVDCQGDFEEHWRKSHYLQLIRHARHCTREFAFEVDGPGSAARIIKNWEKKWRDHPDRQTIIAPDLILAAEYCGRNRWHSFLILDGDVLTAGLCCMVCGSDLLATVMFRDKTYGGCHVGTRLLDLTVQWAAEHGFAKLDLGGWYSYKAKWGPQDGERWDFRICPLRQHLRDQITWKAQAVPGKLKALVRWLPAPSGAPGARDSHCAQAKQLREAPKAQPGNSGLAYSFPRDRSGTRDNGG